MKVVTWNVNGIRARQEQVRDLIAAEQPDIICLQEIKAPPEKVPDLLVAADEYWACWHGGGGYSGVALLARRDVWPQAPDFHHPPCDMEHRIVAATIGGITIASVYVPNGGKDYEAKLRFLDDLTAWVDSCAPARQPMLICGDINIALEDRDVHPKERKTNQIGTRMEERSRLEGLIDRGLADVGRRLDPDNENLFTWWAPWRKLRERNIGWRIDYVLASEALAARATAAESRRTFGTSDHAPVLVTFS